MNKHSFDTLSAALGAIAVAAAVIVITGSFDTLEPGTGWWLTLFALVLGVGLIPWTRRHPESRDVSIEHDRADD